jgi:tRNA(Ile)-lysidine synthase
MAPERAIESRLAATWPPEAWADVTVLLAVSGGPDSVALLRAMAALSGTGEASLLVAHVNHQLRGDASDADEAFVVDLCHRLGVPCEVHRAQVDEIAADLGDGLEAAARSARYQVLEKAAARLGARYVVTAHTADDQAETILHRIVRGSGIAGLAGIARARPLGAATLIRPLLEFRRAELIDYLNELGQAYRVDASNDDTRLTRNRIRHELLPTLAERFNPGVVDALLRLGVLAGEVQTVIDGIVEDLHERCVVEQGPGGVLVDVEPLVSQPEYVIRELMKAIWRSRGLPLQAMGMAQWRALAEMVSGCGLTRPPLRQMFPGAVLVEARPQGLLLVRTTDPEVEAQPP